MTEQLRGQVVFVVGAGSGIGRGAAQLLAARGMSVVCVDRDVAAVGNPNMVGYSATKAGMIGMVKAQGKEYAEDGITVNALAPAVIQTAFLDSQPPEVLRYMTDKIPMRRTGTIEEVAEMLAFMVSPACSFTTGFTFDLSGGRATY